VHTSEARGREEKHAKDYEAPETDFIDIDTTEKSVEASLTELLAILP
jgi:adenylylsulfate kinase-like enzyme